MLVQVIYASRAIRPFSDRDLVLLLRKSRDRNRRHGITGMLVYQEPIFLQVLEGEAGELEPVWRDIAADPRHGQIVELRSGPVESRDYGEWSMGFFNASWNGCAALAGYTRFLDLDFSPEGFAMAPERAIAFMRWIRDAGMGL
ncbi:Sensors of blue-light using FAD [Methylomagnum ishizawai]|uniref:Sensors of blue-light using FAD n=1 Tax=Methylomagnum ishizawai TaxID=1760988 RepID=A0A1Y6CTY1_9GAMM|nr:Sensors of blue-light using FAD [Methylomagnum ishizawai]